MEELSVHEGWTESDNYIKQFIRSWRTERPSQNWVWIVKMWLELQPKTISNYFDKMLILTPQIWRFPALSDIEKDMQRHQLDLCKGWKADLSIMTIIIGCSTNFVSLTTVCCCYVTAALVQPGGAAVLWSARTPLLNYSQVWWKQRTEDNHYCY